MLHIFLSVFGQRYLLSRAPYGVRKRCLILATDGVWNVLNPDMAVDTVFDAEHNNEKFMINPQVRD